MKKLYIIITILIWQFSTCQSLADTQDFIIDNIQANSPLSNYHNGVFFGKDIMKSDAERLANKSLSYDELSKIFIYMYDVFNNSGSNNLFSVAHIIDIRDITKVSTTKVSDKSTYYKISVYIGNKYYAKEYENLKIKEPSWKYLEKMEILVSDNYETVQKLKKAIIHLGKTQGIIVKDGDLF